MVIEVASSPDLFTSGGKRNVGKRRPPSVNSVDLFRSASVFLSVRLSVCLSLWLFDYNLSLLFLSVCLSVCLSVRKLVLVTFAMRFFE